MNPSDKAEFCKVVLGFAELKGKSLSLPAVELYWGAMRDWELADFKAAAEHLLNTCEFMPTPKDFNDLRKAGRDSGAEAFAGIRRYLKWTVRGYVTEPDTPPLIARCINAIGGANAIAMCDEEKLHFLERRFCEHYETMQDSDEVRLALPQVTSTMRPQITYTEEPT